MEHIKTGRRFLQPPGGTSNDIFNFSHKNETTRIISRLRPSDHGQSSLFGDWEVTSPDSGIPNLTISEYKNPIETSVQSKKVPSVPFSNKKTISPQLSHHSLLPSLHRQSLPSLNKQKGKKQECRNQKKQECKNQKKNELQIHEEQGGGDAKEERKYDRRKQKQGKHKENNLDYQGARNPITGYNCAYFDMIQWQKPPLRLLKQSLMYVNDNKFDPSRIPPGGKSTLSFA